MTTHMDLGKMIPIIIFLFLKKKLCKLFVFIIT